MEIKAPNPAGGVLRGLRSEGTWPIFILLVAGGLVLGFGLLAEEVVEGDTTGFDRAVLMRFAALGTLLIPLARLGWKKWDGM